MLYNHKFIKQMEILLVVLGVLALMVGIILYSTFVWGYVASKFYYWFVLPIFPTLPHLSLMQIIGITFFVYVIMPKAALSDVKDEYRDKSSQLVTFFITPWVTLILGYIFLHFI